MERVKHALNKARIERHEKLSNTEHQSSNTHPDPTASPQELRNMMLVALALMAFSVMGLFFLFWYISDLKSEFIRQDDVRVDASGQLLKAPEAASRIGELIAREVSSGIADPTSPSASNEADIVDVYYGDALIRMQVIGKLSGNDADYVAALDKLKQGSNSTVPAQTIAKADAKTIRVKESKAGASVDHFNRVIVEEMQGSKVSNKLTFSDRIQQAVEEGTGNTPDSENKDNYIASLNQAAEERKNETRIIKVRRGDSLWVIARRAYGTGFKYPRIYAANPHLTNPDEIEVGDFLRVPL